MWVVCFGGIGQCKWFSDVVSGTYTYARPGPDAALMQQCSKVSQTGQTMGQMYAGQPWLELGQTPACPIAVTMGLLVRRQAELLRAGVPWRGSRLEKDLGIAKGGTSPSESSQAIKVEIRAWTRYHRSCCLAGSGSRQIWVKGH